MAATHLVLQRLALRRLVVAERDDVEVLAALVLLAAQPRRAHRRHARLLRRRLGGHALPAVLLLLHLLHALAVKRLLGKGCCASKDACVQVHGWPAVGATALRLL